jgi:hypothetical protein
MQQQDSILYYRGKADYLQMAGLRAAIQHSLLLVFDERTYQ